MSEAPFGAAEIFGWLPALRRRSVFTEPESLVGQAPVRFIQPHVDLNLTSSPSHRAHRRNCPEAQSSIAHSHVPCFILSRGVYWCIREEPFAIKPPYIGGFGEEVCSRHRELSRPVSSSATTKKNVSSPSSRPSSKATSASASPSPPAAVKQYVSLIHPHP